MALMPRALGAQRPLPAAPEPAPLRRCTFRRVTASQASPRDVPVYEVSCMFPDRGKPILLGDIEAARPTCSSCTYQGIFRADSD